MASRLATELHAAGYLQPRWYPIGLGYAHGFAATTRLEALNEDATSKGPAERWSKLFPEAANLRWLAQARTVPLPRAGRYRVFLIAVTDLPVGSNRAAPIWTEDTVMEGPGVSQTSPLGLTETLRSNYTLAVFVYQYDRQLEETQGRFNATEGTWPATAQLRAAGLARLGEATFVDSP